MIIKFKNWRRKNCILSLHHWTSSGILCALSPVWPYDFLVRLLAKCAVASVAIIRATETNAKKLLPPRSADTAKSDDQATRVYTYFLRHRILHRSHLCIHIDHSDKLLHSCTFLHNLKHTHRFFSLLSRCQRTDESLRLCLDAEWAIRRMIRRLIQVGV